MKKTLFALAALAALATACVKEQQPSGAPAGSYAASTIKISVAPQSKVALDEISGACKWQDGDKIAVWFDDPASEDAATGQRVVYTFKGLLEDDSAEFVTDATITDGYVAARVTYPAECLDSKGGWKLIRDWEYKEGFIPMYARTEKITTNPDGSLSAQLYHNASVFKFTLHDIPAYAAGFVLESKKYAAGEDVDKDNNKIDKENVIETIKITTKFPYKTGYTADPSDDSNDIQLYSVAAVDSYLYRIYLIDGDGDEIEGSEKKFKQSWNDVSSNDFIELPLVDFKKASLSRDYVKVCGIKWATGNLQCATTFNADGATGFQKGWRLAPNQWHNLKYVEASEVANNTATAYTWYNSVDAFEHFTYGGIANQSRTNEANCHIVPSGKSLDISGKIYSDVNAVNEVTGSAAFKELNTFTETFHNELWGDVAYWASKGKYRLPKEGEMMNLHNISDKIPGYYKTSDGHVVYGYLFRSPNPTREYNVPEREFTDADLESGLFLPKSGRRGGTQVDKVINVMTQANYRTSTYVGTVTYSKTTYYCSAYFDLGNGGKLYDDNLKNDTNKVESVVYSNGNGAGNCIRPVLVEE